MQTIQRSDDLSAIVERNTMRVADVHHAPVTHAAAAKHRIESLRKPRCRFVIFIDSLIATAEEVIATRSSNVDCMWAFLSMLDEEEYLLCAMMCDATDEGMGLKGFLDDDNFDIAELNTEVGRFLNRISALFVHEVAKDTGYTAAALQIMKTPRALRVRGGGVRKFGGAQVVTARMLSRCFDVLRCRSHMTSPQHSPNSAMAPCAPLWNPCVPEPPVVLYQYPQPAPISSPNQWLLTVVPQFGGSFVTGGFMFSSLS